MDERHPVAVGLSLLPADDVESATRPLFEEGIVDAVEWSVDFGFDGAPPAWIAARLDEYEARDELYAHGVELSPMSVDWSDEQERWVESLRTACARRRFRHLTEHYGFMTADGFVRGTPLPLPPSRAALDLAKRRFAMLRDVTDLEVGVENLAFAFSREDALAQATFMRRLLDESVGFLLLDVHNLLCQIETFELDPEELLARYPLERVREIHVAGGHVAFPRADPRRRAFRRDSHDESVPDAAFALLERIVSRAPSLEVVILERSDRSLFGTEEAARHRADFRRVVEIVRRAEPLRQDGPATPRADAVDGATSLVSDNDASLARYQRVLLGALGERSELDVARAKLANAAPRYAAHTATFEPRAWEIATHMALEWSAPTPTRDGMAAAIFLAPDTPLVIRSLPRVTPGPGQILLRTEAVGLCGTDLHILRGRFPVPAPIVLGHETVGIVEALGEGVTELELGDRVGASWVQSGCGACARCRAGEVVRCASPTTWVENGGGLSELVVAEASGCTKVAERLSAAEACPLFCAGHTVMSGYLRARPKPGDRVAVLGLGGLGHLAIQIARAEGHDVVALSSRGDKRADALALGASVAPAYDDDPGVALESAGGADIVLATTSSYADVTRVLSGVSLGGRVVVMGLGDGALVLEPMDLIQREVELLFSVQGPRSHLERVLALASAGRVRARLETYPLGLVNRALSRIEQGRVRYRAVITL